MQCIQITPSLNPERQPHDDNLLLHTSDVNFEESLEDGDSGESRFAISASLDLAAVYLRYHAMLRNFAGKCLPSHLKSEEDIAVATVFTRLLAKQNHGTLGDIENWEAYLVTAVRNACRDIVKLKKNEEELDDKDMRLHGNALSDPTSDSVIEEIMQKEKQAIVRVALESLDDQSRRIVAGKVENNLSNAEIGRQLGLTGQRVGQIAKQAFLRLRGELEQHHVQK